MISFVNMSFLFPLIFVVQSSQAHVDRSFHCHPSLKALMDLLPALSGQCSEVPSTWAWPKSTKIGLRLKQRPQRVTKEFQQRSTKCSSQFFVQGHSPALQTMPTRTIHFHKAKQKCQDERRSFCEVACLDDCYVMATKQYKTSKSKHTPPLHGTRGDYCVEMNYGILQDHLTGD